MARAPHARDEDALISTTKRTLERRHDAHKETFVRDATEAAGPEFDPRCSRSTRANRGHMQAMCDGRGHRGRDDVGPESQNAATGKAVTGGSSGHSVVAVG